MKKLLVALYIVFAATCVQAQKVYFIYLQSETSVPFYIKMGEKVMSSSTEGYLIVPKLRDSTYNFFIGFAGTQNEQRFSVNINKADRGFVIKKFNEGISLFDLQTLTNYNPVQASAGSAPTQTKSDSFTKLLSQAADDTTLLVESLAIKEVKKEEPKTEAVGVTKPGNSLTQDSITQQVATTPEPVIENSEKVSAGGTAVVAKEDPVKEKTAADTTVVIASSPLEIKKEQADESLQEFRRSVVLRHAESSTSEGFGLVFLDVTDGLIDTVRIVIPNPSVAIEPQPQAPSISDKKFLDLPDTVNTPVVPSATSQPLATKAVAKCSTLANDDDFFKIRRDMAAKKVEEDMIAQAKKHFKSRCFKTEHIKYLSVLFLSDAGKYQFFDAAHMHVSDGQKFETLQSEIQDPYYINRFKALVAR